MPLEGAFLNHLTSILCQSLTLQLKKINSRLAVNGSNFVVKNITFKNAYILPEKQYCTDILKKEKYQKFY